MFEIGFFYYRKFDSSQTPKAAKSFEAGSFSPSDMKMSFISLSSEKMPLNTTEIELYLTSVARKFEIYRLENYLPERIEEYRDRKQLLKEKLALESCLYQLDSKFNIEMLKQNQTYSTMKKRYLLVLSVLNGVNCFNCDSKIDVFTI